MDKQKKVEGPFQGFYKVEKFVGFISLESKIYRKFQFYAILFFCWLYPLCELYELTEMTSIMGSLKPILQMSSGLDVLIKYHLLISNKSKVKNLLELMEDMYMTYFSDVQKIKIENTLNKITNVLCISIYSLVASFFIIPLFNHKNLPFGSVFMMESEKHFFIAYFIQLMIFISSSSIQILNFIFLISVTAHLSLHVEILHKNITQFGHSEDKRQFDEFLKNSVDHHNKIIKVVNDFNKISSYGLLLENAIASIWCCLTAYYVQNLDQKDLMYYTYLLSLIFGLMVPLLITLCSEEIIKKNDVLIQSMYDYPWYEETPVKRKRILMLLTMAQKPLCYNCRGFIIFSLPQFSSMVEAAYSYVTLLNSISK